MRRWLKRQSETTAKRAVTTYILEPLEARVLLSADLANAVMPVKPVDAVPQQAVVLTLPAQQLGEQYNQPSFNKHSGCSNAANRLDGRFY